jgi:hypothetical protein
VLAAAGPFAGLAALFSWFGGGTFVVEPVVEPGIDLSAEGFENLCYGHGD